MDIRQEHRRLTMVVAAACGAGLATVVTALTVISTYSRVSETARTNVLLLLVSIAVAAMSALTMSLIRSAQRIQAQLRARVSRASVEFARKQQP